MSIKKGRRRKGISPVISNLVLVSAVLSAGLFLWWFAITRTNIVSADYADEIGSGIERLEERFLVEHIKFTGSEGGPYTALDIWVYNYGKIGVTVKYIYLERNLIPDDSYVTNIDRGDYAQITIGGLNIPEIPEFIQVETERGYVVIATT